MIPDVQAEPDPRGIAIDEVGIAGLRYPITFDDGRTVSPTIAEFAISVGLPAERRGTHMSRMVALIDTELRIIDPCCLPRSLKAAADRLEASRVTIDATLEIATQVEAPISKHVSWQAHALQLHAALDGDTIVVETSVTTDVTSLCPCSKAISDYGAHNQRSTVTLTVLGTADTPYPVPVDAMVQMIRSVGSYPVFPVVKRPDERELTMRAYERPAFVEDMVRDLSLACRTRGVRHRIAVRNLESIHSHDAVARLSLVDLS